MFVSAKSKEPSIDPTADDFGAIAMSTWKMRRFRDFISLICCSVTACYSGADPGAIEQLVRATLH